MELYGHPASSADRQLLALPETSHYDLYDKPEPTQKALEQIIPFFKKHLGLV
ncbi:UNVERIFIED_CONTAM: hypothetical protein RF649_13970 [Kocuria sp. CPCC 205295]|uniref:hypothetical protein n=1 Tax=Kocuria TaxID=57493 RepID=UPI002301C4EE|nr:hypothetical protein [Kocuria palustris]